MPFTRFMDLKTAFLFLIAYVLPIAANASSELKPFTAQYSSQWDLGISLAGSAERSLSKNSDGSYTLKTSASAMVAKLIESSTFEFKDNKIKPLNYAYQRKILNNKRNVDVDFDWPNFKVKNTAGGSSWVMDILPNTQDKQSVQMRLQLDLANLDFEKQTQGTVFSYEVADGGHPKTYQFVIDGEDKIDTPEGSQRSIRVKRDRGDESERETWIWFAPELDYSIVKILQIEADGKRYQLNLAKLTWLD